MQIPSYPNPYMVQQQTMYTPMPNPNYNAVKIDIHNPSVGTQGIGYPQTAPMMPQPQYATPTMPYYSYPQAQLYDYPQAQQMPYYTPQQTVCPPCPVCQPVQQAPVQPIAQTPAPAPQAIEVPAPVVVPQPQVVQQNINAPQTPAPVVTEAPVEAAAPQKPEIAAPQEIKPQVDLNAFISKLTNPDYEVQATAMEEIANMVKDTPDKATELLDAKVIDSLTNIMKADSSKLAGPTQEQINLRQKLMNGQKLTADEEKTATTITPMEQAERNKSYAMFTTAILQKLYGDEIAKLTNTTVPLTELPGAGTVVDQLKDNPNPMVRTSAIEALSYIQNPSYKQDLTTLFSVAKNDQDKTVQETAAAALDKLNKI